MFGSLQARKGLKLETLVCLAAGYSGQNLQRAAFRERRMDGRSERREYSRELLKPVFATQQVAED